MDLSSTQSAIVTSRCKQENNEGKNCDARKTRQCSMSQKRTMLRQSSCSLSAKKAIFWAVILANFIAIASSCPSECSCAVEGTAFCNNKRLNKTPVGLTTSVESLYLFNNNITAILPRTLQPLKNLKLLDLSGNRITNYALWDGLFSQLNLLENLMLQENRITRIDKGMFKGLTNLARIYLHNNKISEIETGAFNNLPNLIELKLRNNRITSFPRLQYTPNLLLLDLGFNRLSTIRDMVLSTVNLEYLKLQGNKLTQLRTSVFDDTSHLTHLDISGNRLTAVPQVIKSFTSLHFLNMSLNTIGVIPPDTFRIMNRLKVLDLHNTGVKSLPFGIIPPKTILNVFDITGNDWDCDCSSHWLPEYLRIFEMAFVNPNELTCSADSKQAGKRLKDLTEGDFECTKEEKAKLSSSTTEPTTTSRLRSTKKPWAAPPCDVYPCFNGGICYVSGHHPKCRCARHWSGPQCQRSLTTTRPTRKTTVRTTTTIKPFDVRPPAKPRLLINEDSVTENSVEIILPQTETELVLSVSEIGTNRKLNQLKIKPRAHPYTVAGLKPGKSYNICIHLQLREKKRHIRHYVDTTDTLCGSVKTSESRIMHSPIAPTKIKVIPSHTGFNIEDDAPTENNGPNKPPDIHKHEIRDRVYGDEKDEPASTESEGFDMAFPAIGAAIGALIIIAVMTMFFVCYKKRQNRNLKSPDTLDYIPGSSVNANQIADMDQAPVVQHLHNHYNVEANPKERSNKRANNHKNNLTNNNFARKSAAPNETDSVSQSSDSNSDTLLTRYADSPRLYSGTQYAVPPTPGKQTYAPVLQQRNARASESMYRNHQNDSIAVLPAQNNHRSSVGGHYGRASIGDMQPSVNGMAQHPYMADERVMRHDLRPISFQNDCAPPTGFTSPYSQANPRSAFLPVQNPRNRELWSNPNSSNAAYVPPTSQCPVRSHIVDKTMRYQEGVPVV